MGDLVQQARAALEGVTPGPWETSCHPWPTQIGTCPLVGNPRSAHHRMINVAAANTDEDIRFIAASRDLVPAMADEIERLRAALAQALVACRIVDDVAKAGHETLGGMVAHFLEAIEPARAALAEDQP